jgi:micrococcal nuclease
MKKSLIILMTVLTTALFAFDVGQVLRVVDGDTLVIQIKGKEERVRLLGVDTPESVHPTKPVEPGALEASAFTKQLEGSQVVLTYDENRTDFFGRVLAYVWVEHPPGRLICWNVYLIQTGHGELYDKYKFGQIEWFISQLE